MTVQKSNSNATLIEPHSNDAEQAVLGAMMLEADAVERAADLLTPSDFYRESHRTIFAAMLSLMERVEPVDIVTLHAELCRMGRLEETGGAHYLSVLNMRTPTAANVMHHAQLVYERSLKRRLMGVARDILATTGDDHSDAFASIERAEAAVGHLTETIGALPRAGSGRDEIAEHESVITDVGKLILYPPPEECIPTGFEKLDARVGGLRPGELTMIGGRPGSGKTGFVLSLGHNIGLERNIPTVLFELEMGQRQIWHREIGWLTGINHRRFESELRSSVTGHRFNDAEQAAVQEAVGLIQRKSLFIDSRPYYTIPMLRSRIRRLIDSRGIRVVLIDYAGKLKVEMRNRQRSDELSFITDALKGMAKEFNLPVVALHQLNRESEKHSDPRPTMADFKGSGSFEEDADNVWLCYRPEYYKLDQFENGESAAGKGDIMVEKFRNGETGFCRLAFIAQHARWDNLAIHDNAPTRYQEW